MILFLQTAHAASTVVVECRHSTCTVVVERRYGVTQSKHTSILFTDKLALLFFLCYLFFFKNFLTSVYMTDTCMCLSVCVSSAVAALKEENDSLRWQLDAYRNEVELLKKEQGRSGRPEEEHAPPEQQQVQLLQQRMHSMQQVLPQPTLMH